MAIAVIVAGVAFTSCRDDSDYPEVETPGTIEIVSRELSFPAAASQGNIVVKASHPVTVTTDVDQPWMTAVVDGNVITVNVTENTSLYGRVSNLTLHSGTGKAYVSVIQSGLIFDRGVSEIDSDDDGKTLVYMFKANVPEVLVTSDVDWCHPSVVNGELIVELDANDTGHMRQGSITYKCSTIEGVIPVRQCDFDKDIAGPCKFMYDGTKSYDATLSRDGSKYILSLGSDYDIPVSYDHYSRTISIKAGGYVKDIVEKDVTYYLFTVMRDAAAGSYTWGTSIGMAAPLDYTTMSDGTYATIGVFEDDGVWGSRISTSICLEAYKTMTPGSSTRFKRIVEFKNPYFVRY